MSLPNEFLMQVNGWIDRTYYLIRVNEYHYRLRDVRHTDEEAQELGEFPLWDVKLVEDYVQSGSWIITQILDLPVPEDELNFDVESIL